MKGGVNVWAPSNNETYAGADTTTYRVYTSSNDSTATSTDSTATSTQDWGEEYYGWTYISNADQTDDLIEYFTRRTVRPFWCDGAREKVSNFISKEWWTPARLMFRRMMFSKSGWLPMRSPKRPN